MSRSRFPVLVLSMAGALAVMGCSMPSATSADLIVSATTIPATAVHDVEDWPLGATIRNQGSASAVASTIRYWFSADGVLDAGDTLARVSTVGPLAAGASFVDSTEIHSVSDWGGTSGTWYLFVVADALGVVSESNDANNTSRVSVAVLYDRIIIDTYKWSDGAFGTTNTFASLFDSSGDPTLDSGLTLWNDNASPYTVDSPPTSIAEDDDGNLTYAQFARIDYTTGLAPGTYYIRVRGYVSTEVGPYAIRVLTGDPVDPYPAGLYPAGSFFVSANTTDEPYESDDDPASGGTPSSPVAIGIGEAHNRYLQAAGDVDWFVLTLP